jgi:hypothetical protein
MNSLPRNVFTTCPEVTAVRNSVVRQNEYTINFNDGTTVKQLMIVKGSISLADVMKASKCAKINPFVVRVIGSSTKLEEFNFPIKANLVIGKPKVTSSVVTRHITPTFKIYRKDKLLQVCEHGVTKIAIEHAAKCAGMKRYIVTKNPIGAAHAITVTSTTVLHHDVYLRESKKRHPQVFHVCETVSSITGPIALSGVKLSRQKLIRDAIKGLNNTIKALKLLDESL